MTAERREGESLHDSSCDHVDCPCYQAGAREAFNQAAAAIEASCDHRDYRRHPDPVTIWPAERCPFCSAHAELVRGLGGETQ